MSDSENPTPSVDEAKKAANNVLATIMDLKQSNPKVFYGSIVGVVVLSLVMSIGGSSSPEAPVTTLKNHSIGQTYVLRGANSSDANGKIRVVQVPGSIAAFDDTDEDPAEKTCGHLPAETQVKAIGLQDFAGKKDAFVNIEIMSGDCKGKKGWALAIDVQ